MTASLEERNALLNELESAVEEWYTRERARVEDEVTFLRSVLRGRTGSESVARRNTSEARVLVIDDITSFLSGG